MEKLPGITVLVPVLMRHVSVSQIRLLRDALESVADQAYRGDIEILLIDDGSVRPVRSFSGELGPAVKLVRWLEFPNNRGIVSALNAGISAASSPLLARLDSHDVWLDGKIEAQVNQFLEDPDLTITATGMKRVDGDGAEIDQHVRPGDWEGILKFFVEIGCPFPHVSVLAKRRVYQALGGYSWSGNVRHCEDYALWGTWLRFFKPAMVEKPLCTVRVMSGGSISSDHSDTQLAATHVVRSRFEKLELSRVLPKALPALAEAIGGSLFEAGLLAYRAWHFRTSFAIPGEAIAPLAAVLPDRVLTRTASARHWRSVIGGKEAIDGEGFHAFRAESLR